MEYARKKQKTKKKLEDLSESCVSHKIFKTNRNPFAKIYY